jgi:hypothetical protein
MRQARVSKLPHLEGVLPMLHFRRWMAAAALGLVAGCGGERAKGGITPTGPSFVGATASVTVNCPTQMETGTSGTCTAYGYDSNGSYTNSSVSSWSSSNTSVATITSGGGISAVSAGTATITAVIDGISGTRGVTVVNPPPGVWIDGPGSVRPNTMCAWWAIASGGTTPYTYTWSGPSSNASQGGEYYGTSPASGTFTVSVTVTDAASATATVSKQVTVSSSAPLCAL